MSDTRRVMVIRYDHNPHGEMGRWFNHPEGHHAIVEWDEIERLRAVVEAARRLMEYDKIAQEAGNLEWDQHLDALFDAVRALDATNPQHLSTSVEDSEQSSDNHQSGEPCPTCGGKQGWWSDGGKRYDTCPTCCGEGKSNCGRYVCEDCNGTGRRR